MSLLVTNSLEAEQLFSGLKKDLVCEVSIDLIQRGKNGEGQALYEIGYKYYNEKQYPKAIDWYQLSANSGYAKASYLIGTMYCYGTGVGQDYYLALEWFLKSALQNYLNACFEIAQLFENGQGVPVDKTKALEWRYKYDNNSYHRRRFFEKEHVLTQQQKDKSIQMLVQETENIIELHKIKVAPTTYLKEKRRTISKVQALEHANLCLKEEIKNQTEDMNTLQGQHEALQKSSTEKQSMISMLEKQSHGYQDEISMLKNEITMVKQSEESIKVEFQEIRENLTSMMDENNLLRSSSIQKQQKINELENTNHNMEQESKSMRMELDMLKKSDHQSKQKAQDLENKILALENENISLQILHAQNEKDASSRSTLIGHMKETTQKMLDEINLLKKQNRTLEEQLKSKDDELLSLNKSLLAASQVKPRNSNTRLKSLEQLIELKNSEMKLMKSEFEDHIEKEKRKYDKDTELLEKKFHDLQKKLDTYEISMKQNHKYPNIGGIKYTTENDNGDLNYDSQGEDNSDNDLNYDSDEQPIQLNKVTI